MKKTFLLGFTALWCGLSMLSAQVTIGADNAPQPFSVLELISGNDKGLRLPQLTTTQRDDLQASVDFQTEATGKAMGLQIFNTTTLCVETWNGTKWIEACAMCGGAPCIYYPPSGSITLNGGITTFTNVMYDFQQQTIEAYGFTVTPAPPVSYQWYAKRKGTADTAYKGISGATALTYTAPANFITNIWQPLVSENNADYKSDEITLVCLAKYANGTYRKTPEMDILFIGTTTSGYKTINGVKCLTLKKANTTLNVALTNLDDDPNTDAKNLGDFYQWGRVADGHQKTAWSKNASHENQILPMDGVATSATIARDAVATYDAKQQTTTTANDYNKKFITVVSGDWGNENNNRWGNGVNIRAGEDAVWTYWPDNNPCSSGFKVPNRYKFWDIFNGDGSNDPTSFSGSWTAGIGANNTWKWRNMTNNAVGGALITNITSGEILFLPAAGHRGSNDGTLGYSNYGFYWSSTYTSAFYAYNLYFYSNFMHTNSNNFDRATGRSVRCVAE